MAVNKIYKEIGRFTYQVDGLELCWREWRPQSGHAHHDRVATEWFQKLQLPVVLAVTEAFGSSHSCR